MSIFSKPFNWYFKRKALSYWSILLADCLIILATYIVTYVIFRPVVLQWVSLGLGTDLLRLMGWVAVRLLVFLLVYIIGMRLFRTYSGIIRYSSFIDLMRVGAAMILGGILAWMMHYPAFRILPFTMNGEVPFEANIRTRDIFTATIVATFIMWMVRMIVKYTYDTTQHGNNRRNAAIYGVRSGGIALAKFVNGEQPARFKLCAFVSNERNVQNRILMGKHVFATDDRLIERLKDRNIGVLLVSPMQSNAFRHDQALQDALIEADIKIYMVPLAHEWHKGESFNDLKEVKIEDLLPRDEIQVDMDAVGAMLRGKKILITGSAGSIGSEMVRQIALYEPASLILVDQAETPQHDMRLYMHNNHPQIMTETIVVSICREDHMEDIFRRFRPDYVFHAAAYKHVPMMENNPSEAVLNNVLGTRIIADLSVKYGVKKFVMISTDKAVNPTNVMGCSKRICEIYVQSLDRAQKEGKVTGSTQFVTTRFGNVLGSNGSVIPLFRKQIKAGGPVTVTHPDIIRFFMLISEACKLVLEAGTHGKGGEIFVFDMGRPVRIADLAKRMIHLSEATNVEIKYTGLRDGEKLYEEVLNNEENTKPTFNKKIRIAEVRDYDYDEAARQIEKLISISRAYDDMETVREMKHIVPEYKSQHSKYEALDKA